MIVLMMRRSTALSVGSGEVCVSAVAALVIALLVSLATFGAVF